MTTANQLLDTFERDLAVNKIEPWAYQPAKPDNSFIDFMYERGAEPPATRFRELDHPRMFLSPLARVICAATAPSEQAISQAERNTLLSGAVEVIDAAADLSGHVLVAASLTAFEQFYDRQTQLGNRFGGVICMFFKERVHPIVEETGERTAQLRHDGFRDVTKRQQILMPLRLRRVDNLRSPLGVSLIDPKPRSSN